MNEKFKECSQVYNNKPFSLSDFFDGVGVVFVGDKVWCLKVKEIVASVKKEKKFLRKVGEVEMQILFL